MPKNKIADRAGWQDHWTVQWSMISSLGLCISLISSKNYLGQSLPGLLPWRTSYISTFSHFCLLCLFVLCTVYLFMYLCTHMCRCMFTCVEAWSWLWISMLISTIFFFWDRISRWTWGLSIWLDWLVSKLQGSASPPLAGTGIIHMSSHAYLFIYVLGVWNQVLMLVQLVFCWMRHFPSTDVLS